VAVTDAAVKRLQGLQEETQSSLAAAEGPVAYLEVARLQKDEMVARPLPVVGRYGSVTPLVRNLCLCTSPEPPIAHARVRAK
jgi:hypothetical protein